MSPVVLIVEDDVLRRLSMAAALRREGFEVFEAADAREAMTVLDTIAIDVLFSDLSLTGSGELWRWVEQRQLPLRMLMTAYAESQQSAKLLQQ